MSAQVQIPDVMLGFSTPCAPHSCLFTGDNVWCFSYPGRRSVVVILALSAFWRISIDCNGAVVDGFDYPVGSNPYYTQAWDGDGWYNAQDFGAYYSPSGKYHLGEDWNTERGAEDPQECGSPVYSSAHGTIVFAGVGGGTFGNVLIVRHELPDETLVETLYGHLQSFIKTSGEVNRREQVATVGDGNRTVPCHLHFEIRFSNSPDWGQPGPGYSITPKPAGWADPSDFIDSHRFYPGASVEVFNVSRSMLQVRSPDACSTVIGERVDGALSTIIGGPVRCNTGTGYYSRYELLWSDGVQGWSAQNWLRIVPAQSRRVVAAATGVGLKGVDISWGGFRIVSVDGGKYSIPLSLCGTRTLTARKAGYDTLTKTLTIPCPIVQTRLAKQQLTTELENDEVTSGIACSGIPMSTRFAIGDSIEVFNTEIGLRGRFPDACSDTWKTFSDGTTGMVVGGPECCNGYNRWRIRYSGELSDRWSAEGEPNGTEYFLRKTGTPTVAVTVSTAPAGLQINVDGTAYGAPKSFSWSAGSSHAIATTSPQNPSPGTEYVWANWSDGAPVSHVVTPNAATTYTANFTTNISGPILGLTTSAMNFSSDLQGAGIGVRNEGIGTVNWSASTTNGWVHLQIPSGSVGPGDQSFLSFFVDRNPSVDPRIGSITVTATGVAGSPQDLTIMQAGLPTYVLTTPATNGSVIRNPNLISYPERSDVELTAVPAPGYEFSHWSGGATGSDNPVTLTMHYDLTIVANFTILRLMTQLAREGQMVRLTWQATPGANYEVEYKDGFGAAWRTHPAGVIVVGGIANLVDSLDAAQRFYRVLQLQ